MSNLSEFALVDFFCGVFSTMSDSEHEESNDTTSPPTRYAYGRHEKSLGLLTSRFVQLLQNAEGGVLDLRKVCVLCNTRAFQPGFCYVCKPST